MECPVWMFLTENNDVVINEINIAWLYEHQYVPKLWQQAGMTYPQLISRLIELGIEKFQQTAMLKTACDEL